MATYSPLGKPLPADTEARLANFTELLATAIANAESRAELARLAEEQAASRRWWHHHQCYSRSSAVFDGCPPRSQQRVEVRPGERLNSTA